MHEKIRTLRRAVLKNHTHAVQRPALRAFSLRGSRGDVCVMTLHWHIACILMYLKGPEREGSQERNAHKEADETHGKAPELVPEQHERRIDGKGRDYLHEFDKDPVSDRREPCTGILYLCSYSS